MAFKFNVALRPQRPYGLGYYGRGAQDGHLDFHTAPELCESPVQCCFTSKETIFKDYQGREAQDGHLDFHTAPELCEIPVQCCFTSTETVRTIRDGEPRTATSTFTRLLNSACLRTQFLVLFRGSSVSRSELPRRERGLSTL